MQKLLYLYKKNWKKHVKDEEYRKVRDHCCYTGQDRGAANSIRLEITITNNNDENKKEKSTNVYHKKKT